MPRGRGNLTYDDDYDYDEYYDDEDYDEYEDNEVVAPKPAAARAPPKPASAATSAKTQTVAEKKKQEPYPLTPPAPALPSKPSAATVLVMGQPSASLPLQQPFQFDTPSPDDEVGAAILRNIGSLAPAPSPLVGLPRLPAPPPYRPPDLGAAKKQSQASTSSSTPASTSNTPTKPPTAGPTASASSVAATLSAVSLDDQASSSGMADPAPQLLRRTERRPISEYVMEPDLAKLCAAAAESDARDGVTPLHLVVLGHVDAGKSTLMGRLLHELGHVTDKEVHRNQRDAAAAGKASFSWAWVLDERPEERARGVTVDVAQARFTTPRHAVTLLDAPGHRDFVANMITGAAQADAALLVVDGSTGGFEAGFEGSGDGSGQTREHAQLAKSLGVEQLAVVVSKLDTCGYAQDRFEHIKATLLPFLRSAGFKESSLTWLPCVGPANENLVCAPSSPELAAWWSGPCLLDVIDRFTPRERSLNRPLRLPISDVFKGRQGGLGVAGKLEGGALKVGSQVMLVPSGNTAVVKALEVDGKAAALARAGDSVDITLGGLDVTVLPAGTVLCHPDFPAPLVSKFEMRLIVLDTPIPMLRGHQVTIHAHVAREAGVVTSLTQLLNPKTGEVTKQKPRCLLKGQTGVVEVTPARSLVLETAADYRSLGRVALRDCGRTIAVGIVSRVLEWT